MATVEEANEIQIEPTHHENLVRVVWALAWPAVALNSLQVVNTLIDRFFIGHLPLPSLIGHSASMNVMFLMFSLAIAVATGATAIVSRAWGAGEKSELRHASRQAVSLSIICGVVCGIVTYSASAIAAKFLLPSDDLEAQRQMSLFLSIYAISLPAVNVIQTLAGCLRGVGDTKSPMVISGCQILMHITMNFFFVYPHHEVSVGGTSFVFPGMGWGLPGAAAALTISTWIAAVVYLVYSARTPLGSLWRLQIPNLEWAKRILRIAAPAAAMAILRVGSLATYTLVLKVVPDGDVAIAAMGVSFSIESIMFMPAFGLSAAAGALVGQSLGMRKPQRAEKIGWIAGNHGALVTLALCLPIYFGAPVICHAIVGDKQAVIEQAMTLLRYLCCTEIFFAYAMVMLGAMQGAGDTVRPFWITVVALWGLRVPLAAFFSLSAGQLLFESGNWNVCAGIGLGLGAHGAWLAVSATQAVQGILSILAFKQGRWKTMKV